MEQNILRVAIAGAGGFIGSALKEDLRKRNCSVISLSRTLLAMPLPQLINLLEGTDVIVNLAGASIISRWTRANKSAIYDSRIVITRKLASAIDALKSPPQLFISGSAVGIYKGNGIHTESSNELAGDFLGKLCRDWETEALNANGRTRVVIFRTGIVLGKEGGALSRMLPLFRAGFGGVIASGEQGVSWIHLQDVLKAFDFIISNPGLSGVFNITAPKPVNNRILSKTLSRLLKKGLFLPVPAIMLKLLYGEGAQALTEGQMAFPEKLIEAGFRFEFDELEPALSDLLRVDHGGS